MIRHALRINPIRCDGYGYCAELFPERVGLDDWGYPIVDPRLFGPELLEHARRAVSACPRLALRIEERQVSRTARTRPPGGRRR